ncbi:MAG: hypothetical protein ABIB79_01955 [archaeon]
MRRGEQDYYVKKKGVNMIVFLLYIILGVYFINVPFNFFKIPDIVTKYNNWIVFAGGILMLFGAINYFQAKRR